MTAKTPHPPETGGFRAERPGALLALVVRQPPPLDAESHPAAEELAAFSEGRLDPAKRERLLAHLDACSDCYREWLAVARALAADPPASRRDRSPPKLDLRRRRRRAWLWSGAGLALAACLALALLAPWRPDSGLPLLIEEAYNTVQGAPPPSLRETAARWKLPWEEPAPVYGFSASTGDAAARAFAAGLWEGRATLAGDARTDFLPAFLGPAPTRPAELGAWRDTDWADYALLGRWVFLLQTVCRTPQADGPAFWSQQRAVAAAMRDRLARRTAAEALARPVVAVVRELETALSDPALAASRARLCGQVERNASRLIALLTPLES